MNSNNMPKYYCMYCGNTYDKFADFYLHVLRFNFPPPISILVFGKCLICNESSFNLVKHVFENH